MATGEASLIRTPPIGVVVAEDEHVAAAGLAAWLGTASDIAVLGICNRPEEVVPAIERHSPDVLLLDLHFPNSRQSGVNLLPHIRAVLRPPKVLVISTHITPHYVLGALKAGVDGYIWKSTSNDDDVMEAIRAVHNGRPRFSPEVMQIVRMYMPDASNFTSESDQLTAREWDVLALIARGFNNNQIADELVIAEKTVKVHVGNILRKTGVADRKQAAVWYRTADHSQKE